MTDQQQVAFLAGGKLCDRPAEEVVEVLAKLGYDGIEWTRVHADPDRFGPRRLAELVELTHVAGLLVSELVIQVDFLGAGSAPRRDRLDYVRRCIDAAADAGVGLVNVFSGPATWDPSAVVIGRDLSYAQAWDQARWGLAELADYGSSKDVTLAIEAVFRMVVHDYFSLATMLNELPDSVGVNLDPSHLVLYGNDPTFAVERLGSRVKHVHLKDAFGYAGQVGEKTFHFPPVGSGQVEWQAFLKALDAIHYDGFCSFEYEADGFAEQICGGDLAVVAAECRRAWIALTQEGKHGE